MTEQGVVIRLLSTQVAEIGCRQSGACSKCGVCRPGVETGRLIIEAQNSLGAKVDDLVEFELPTGQFIRDSIMVFIIPLVALFVGYMVGVQVVSSEIAGIILALIFFVAGIFAVRWYDKNVVTRAQLRATITKIIN